MVQGDETGDTPLSEYVKTYIKIRYKKPGEVFLGVIHRLDRPVSGVVVFARTSKALSRMNKLFQDRKIEKTYWAITVNRPEPINGRLEHYILKDRSRNVSRVFDKIGKRTQDAKKGVLDYQLMAQLEGKCLLQVNPITGRPHQIRVQLASMGCPIIGDLKYGFPRANRDATIHLHCRELSFVHPVKKEPVQIRATPPEDQVWNSFQHLYGE